MAQIRPCADLRNNYNEISKICHETNEPVYITKNGYSDLVILSNSTYENLTKKLLKSEEERIDKLISQKFDSHYSDFEEFKKDFYSKIDQALKEVADGKCRPFKEFCAEIEEKYDFLQ